MRSLLDRKQLVVLEGRALALAMTAVLAVLPGTAAADRVVDGALVPAGAVELEPLRFNANMSWEQLLKWYEKVYPRPDYERIDVINQPGIKAIHIKNAEAKGKWEGINVYEHQGRVKIFVVTKRKDKEQKHQGGQN